MPLLISSGEPAGIGPDICLALAGLEIPLVVIGDIRLLRQRAEMLNLNTLCYEYQPNKSFIPQPGRLAVLSLPCDAPVIAGKVDVANAPYVISMLTHAVDACLDGRFSAVVTAPVHKEVINKAEIPFTGHTEFFAQRCSATVVMMLTCPAMRVALITTHLPLKAVSKAIDRSLIIRIIRQLHDSLQRDFGIEHPRIQVAGLNPHAGEGGYLGREEIEIIIPALEELRSQGLQILGPCSADTMFAPKNSVGTDVFVCMYHDQGLPVLKYAGFGDAVNVSLGLPIIRTSVDHGTALTLAGTGKADTGSLIAAVRIAASMVESRRNYRCPSSA